MLSNFSKKLIPKEFIYYAKRQGVGTLCIHR